MFRIKVLNTIAEKGLRTFDEDRYSTEVTATDYDAILLRSASLLELSFPPSLKAIARAGTGVNNIPVERATAHGVVVFNTPGANANSVKELVLAALLLSSRGIFEGILWSQSLSGLGPEVPQLVEKKKREFTGRELKGKTLGIVGLGAVGSLVAHAAIALDMKVVGFDPYISIDGAWGISHSVLRARSFESLLGQSDYLTLHTPLTPDTRHLLNEKTLRVAKRGLRVMNFARPEIVDPEALQKALQTKHVGVYITDFPEDELLGTEGILTIPHLGASTTEAEENCAVMAATELKEYLETGNISNSVNFPNCVMEMSGHRLLVANRNIPSIVGQLTSILARERINISDMLNRHREQVAYNIINVDSPVSESIQEEIRSIEGILFVRSIAPSKN